MIKTISAIMVSLLVAHCAGQQTPPATMNHADHLNESANVQDENMSNLIQIGLLSQYHLWSTITEHELAALHHWSTKLQRQIAIQAHILPQQRMFSTILARVLAAHEALPLVLCLFHPTTTPGDIVNIALIHTESGNIVAETSVPRKYQSGLLDRVTQWLHDYKLDLQSIAHFNPQVFAHNLATQGYCKEAIYYAHQAKLGATQHTTSLQHIIQQCQVSERNYFLTPEPKPIGLKTVGVAAADRVIWTTALQNSDMLRFINNELPVSTNLLVKCDDRCKVGHMELVVQLDSQFLMRHWRYAVIPPERTIEQLAQHFWTYRQQVAQRSATPPPPMQLKLEKNNATTLTLLIDAPSGQLRIQGISKLNQFIYQP